MLPFDLPEPAMEGFRAPASDVDPSGVVFPWRGTGLGGPLFRALLVSKPVGSPECIRLNTQGVLGRVLPTQSKCSPVIHWYYYFRPQKDAARTGNRVDLA